MTDETNLLPDSFYGVLTLVRDGAAWHVKLDDRRLATFEHLPNAINCVEHIKAILLADAPF